VRWAAREILACRHASASTLIEVTTNDDEARRRAWFEGYVRALDSGSRVVAEAGGPYRCPCCHKRTVDEPGGFDICPVCYWEDDGQDDHDADIVRGGPNGALSLTKARENYLRIGACEEKVIPHVRSALPDEE
jgi:hypothetical protein